MKFNNYLKEKLNDLFNEKINNEKKLKFFINNLND